jgi:hypothetical protein
MEDSYAEEIKRYSRESLEEVLKSLKRDQFPERLRIIETEIASRQERGLWTYSKDANAEQESSNNNNNLISKSEASTFPFRKRALWFIGITYLVPVVTLMVFAVSDSETRSLPYSLFMLLCWPLMALFVPAGLGLLGRYGDMSSAIALLSYLICGGLTVLALTRKEKPPFFFTTGLLVIFFLICMHGCGNQRWTS